MKKEIWQDIKGYEGYYQISNKGRLKVLGAYIKNLGNFANGYLKKVNIKEIAVDRNGYCITKLCRDGKCKPRKIHRLVAQAFLPNPKNLPQVNHIDGVKTNNNFLNLEWCDNSYNQKHAIKNNLKISKFGKNAIRFKSSILVYNKEGELIDELFGNRDMKNKGDDYRNVSAVVNGKRKTYKKLIFKRNEKI